MTDITTSIKKRSGSGRLLLFLAGMLLGGAIASGVFLVLLIRQEQRQQEQIRALAVANNLNPLKLGRDFLDLKNQGKQNDKALPTEEAKIMESARSSLGTWKRTA